MTDLAKADAFRHNADSISSGLNGDVADFIEHATGASGYETVGVAGSAVATGFRGFTTGRDLSFSDLEGRVEGGLNIDNVYGEAGISQRFSTADPNVSYSLEAHAGAEYDWSDGGRAAVGVSGERHQDFGEGHSLNVKGVGFAATDGTGLLAGAEYDYLNPEIGVDPAIRSASFGVSGGVVNGDGAAIVRGEIEYGNETTYAFGRAAYGMVEGETGYYTEAGLGHEVGAALRDKTGIGFIPDELTVEGYASYGKDGGISNPDLVDIGRDNNGFGGGVRFKIPF